MSGNLISDNGHAKTHAQTLHRQLEFQHKDWLIDFDLFQSVRKTSEKTVGLGNRMDLVFLNIRYSWDSVSTSLPGFCAAAQTHHWYMYSKWKYTSIHIKFPPPPPPPTPGGGGGGWKNSAQGREIKNYKEKEVKGN